MMTTGRSMVFSLAFGVIYTFAYYFGWPVVVYYPVEIHVSFLEQSPAAGQQILWYGWLACAVVFGAAAAFIVPARWSAKLPPDLAWLGPIMLIVTVFAYELRWFL